MHHPASTVGNFTGRHVGDGHRDEERGNAVRATVRERHGVVGIGVHATDTGTDNHAGTGRIFGLGVDTGVLEGLESGIDGILDALREPGLVAAAEVFGAVEFPDGGGNLDRQGGHVESVDNGNAGLALQEAVPKELR